MTLKPPSASSYEKHRTVFSTATLLLKGCDFFVPSSGAATFLRFGRRPSLLFLTKYMTVSLFSPIFKVRFLHLVQAGSTISPQNLSAMNAASNSYSNVTYLASY